MDPVDDVIAWADRGLEVKVLAESLYGSHSRQIRSEDYYYRGGVAFTMIGASFRARLHAWRSVIDSMGSSVYSPVEDLVQCSLNSSRAQYVMESLNPTMHFQLGDVDRVPLAEVSDVESIVSGVRAGFTRSEASREVAIDFVLPGPSPWRHAQEWAQFAVDRSDGEPLPPYMEELDAEPSTDHMSFALGAALGRFDENGGGILDLAKADLANALPAGICFLDGTLDPRATDDSLGHSTADLLRAKWKEHGPAIARDSDLRTWLRLRFFPDVHKGMYENRPIHWPLSSAKKTFVAYVTVHRWNEDTLRALLAEHLEPALTRLEGQLTDVREARASDDKKTARQAERRHDQLVKWKEELEDFIANVEQCAEKGPPPPDDKTPAREVDARYAPDLDDGVMINSAALWPLLEPQWKDPKRSWKELASAKGKKDYDWSHLAARYFPKRVDGKCKDDPSLAVAHGCFWRYHPQNAYKWELRLQDEIGPDFTLDEEGSDEARASFERDHPKKVEQLVAAEMKRRERKSKKATEERATDPEASENEVAELDADEEPTLFPSKGGC